MQQYIVEMVNGVHVPWGSDQQKLAKSVANYVACDSFAVGIVNLNSPQADELLAIHAMKPGAVANWPGSVSNDAMISTAIREGVAICYPGSKSGNSVVVMLPESIRDNRYWWFTVSRNGNKPFSTADQQKAQILLRRWQARFLMPDEQSMGRIMVGHDMPCACRHLVSPLVHQCAGGFGVNLQIRLPRRRLDDTLRAHHATDTHRIWLES